MDRNMTAAAKTASDMDYEQDPDTAAADAAAEPDYDDPDYADSEEEQAAGQAAGSASRSPAAGDGGGGKQCMECREQKPAEEFPRNRRRVDGRDNRCKKCTARMVSARLKSKAPVNEPTGANVVWACAGFAVPLLLMGADCVAERTTRVECQAPVMEGHSVHTPAFRWLGVASQDG